jgi:hypothetical protein
MEEVAFRPPNSHFPAPMYDIERSQSEFLLPSLPLRDASQTPHATCAWCASRPPLIELMSSEFPSEFVWTKMQAEAGQSLEEIVHRKELERLAGGGIFFWGVGNALGNNLTRLLARDPTPSILFSIMKGKPRRADVSPSGVLIWTSYVDSGGRLQPLPSHALVLSRSVTALAEKRRHYALVCESSTPLRLGRLGGLNSAHFRNLGSSAPSIGSSQVTAVIEHVLSDNGGVVRGDDGTELGRTLGAHYDVNMMANMAKPYFVRLAQPRLISEDTRSRLATIRSSGLTPMMWSDLVIELRQTAQGTPPESDELLRGLFERSE